MEGGGGRRCTPPPFCFYAFFSKKSLGDPYLNLLDFVECPILKDFSDDMIIFNNQCYDYERWSKWLDVQDKVNEKKRKSGFGDSLCDQLLDPISGADVGYRNSMRNDYFSIEVDREKLGDIIQARNPFLFQEETYEFMPEASILRINDFVRHIKKVSKPSETKAKPTANSNSKKTVETTPPSKAKSASKKKATKKWNKEKDFIIKWH